MALLGTLRETLARRAWGLLLAVLVAGFAMALASPASASGGATAWGYNGVGQLGDGDNRLRPGTRAEDEPSIAADSRVQVSGLSGVTAVSAGGHHSLALLSNGTVMAWGENSVGQLGTGTTTNSDVPSRRERTKRSHGHLSRPLLQPCPAEKWHSHGMGDNNVW